ncbi:MAG: sugar phosphate isomerase/epimerase family protein [Chloroflexota bacterium]
MQFAICQWYPDLSYEAIESMRADGVTALEPGPSFLLDKDEPMLMAEAKRLQDAGIRVYSVHSPFRGDDDLSLLNEDTRNAAVASHVMALQRAALSGAECLVIHPSGPVTIEEEAQRWRQLYANLETLIPEAESVGVRLALENMLPGHLGAEAASIRRVVDDFDSPALGVCFDTGHAHLNEGGVPEAFAILRERIINFHLQDNDGNRDRHLQPPYGTIDWEAFAPDFLSLSFPHPVAVEAPPWNGGTWGMLLREVHTLFSQGRLTLRLGNSLARVICHQCGRYRMGTPEDWYCGCGPQGGTGDG